MGGKITSDALYLSPYILITNRLTLLHTNHISGSNAHRRDLSCKRGPKWKTLQAACCCPSVDIFGCLSTLFLHSFQAHGDQQSVCTFLPSFFFAVCDQKN